MDIILSEASSGILAMFDQIREGLGTGQMSLDEMIAELRLIRETSDYESAFCHDTASASLDEVARVRALFTGRVFSDSSDLIREDRSR